jgi:FdhE protein
MHLTGGKNYVGGSWTPEGVHRAFQAVAQTESAYAAVLPFFESVYMLQEAAVASARPAPLAAVMAPVDDQPLVTPVQFTIDWSNSLSLLGSLCEQARHASPELIQAADLLVAKLPQPGDFFESSLALLVENRAEDFAAAAADLGTSPDILAFLLFNSAWPSIAHHARGLASQNPGRSAWNKGHCPICGASPFIALLDEEGRRELVCSVCRHQWHTKRILCPFCENGDSRTLNYFFAEEEKAYRVHTCQVCLTYIKSVDARELNRRGYPPLEAILTTHLDLKAQQLGFKNMAPAWVTI